MDYMGAKWIVRGDIMMKIKNDRQYEYCKNKLSMFKEALTTIREKYSSDKNKVKLLSQGHIEHIKQLKSEITAYEIMKRSPLPKVLRAYGADEISGVLVRLRIARGLSQEDLAERVGCKQADISRLEREGYQGYTLNLLNRVAKGLDAKLEIYFTPR